MGNKLKYLISGLTGAVAIAAGVVAHFEGKHNEVYLDPPGIPTICYGHTGPEVIYGSGVVATDAECIEYLEKDLAVADKAVSRLVKVELTDTRKAALISFVYNVGEGNLAKSTLLKELNAGRTKQACDQLLRWVYAGGKKLNGLVRRREAERQLCLKGL